jgi:phosphate transport system protein
MKGDRRCWPKSTHRHGLKARAPQAIVGLRHMNEVATELLKDVLDAYAQRDVERARAVWERDAELDALEDSVFRDLLTHMMEDPEIVFYLITGSSLPAERPKGRHEYEAEAMASPTP